MSEDEKKDLLKKQACFTGLNEEELDTLSSLLVEERVPAGTLIVKQGEWVDNVYLIVEGEADVKITLKDYPDQTASIATLGPEDAIGLNETGFYSVSGIRTATVIAMTDMILLRLSVAAFHGFALAFAHANQVMRVHAQQLLGLAFKEKS
ncbi:MAG TPA: cyclic nucleotide-binding domain-containing protein [Gammaproteobacteria bacterium]|jgi:CRP-like cAMP-binding protein|nr:cyclic nucleotide-binding domain-containing protein [Gammaproteobacteria bacterium]